MEAAVEMDQTVLNTIILILKWLNNVLNDYYASKLWTWKTWFWRYNTPVLLLFRLDLWISHEFRLFLNDGIKQLIEKKKCMTKSSG